MINRSLHRWISLPAAAFLLWIGVTGVILQVNELTEYAPHRHAARTVAPADADVAVAVAKALAAAHATAPTLPATYLQVDLSGPAIKVSVAAMARGATHVDYDAGTGTAAVVTDAPTFHRFIMNLHSGEVIGKVGNAIGLLTGAGLVGLAITGFLVWFDMWRRRARAGKRGLFWTR